MYVRESAANDILGVKLDRSESLPTGSNFWSRIANRFSRICWEM